MNLKQTKPIHLRCPKCKHDFAYNTNHIENEIDKLKCEISDIKAQITAFNSTNLTPAEKKKNQWRKNALAALSFKNAHQQELKKPRKATAVEIKLQTFYVFKRLVAAEIGQDKMIQLVQEAEDQMVYWDYDTAKQKYTKFEGI